MVFGDTAQGRRKIIFLRGAKVSNLFLTTFIRLKLDFNHSGYEQACTNDASKMHKIKG